MLFKTEFSQATPGLELESLFALSVKDQDLQERRESITLTSACVFREELRYQDPLGESWIKELNQFPRPFFFKKLVIRICCRLTGYIRDKLMNRIVPGGSSVGGHEWAALRFSLVEEHQLNRKTEEQKKFHFRVLINDLRVLEDFTCGFLRFLQFFKQDFLSIINMTEYQQNSNQHVADQTLPLGNPFPLIRRI